MRASAIDTDAYFTEIFSGKVFPHNQDQLLSANKTQYLSHTNSEVINMAKKGMKRPENTHTASRDSEPTVPEIQGKAKCGKIHANPIISGTSGPSQKVWHNKNLST
jgi:hypothetical protein